MLSKDTTEQQNKSLLAQEVAPPGQFAVWGERDESHNRFSCSSEEGMSVCRVFIVFNHFCLNRVQFRKTLIDVLLTACSGIPDYRDYSNVIGFELPTFPPAF